LKIHNLDGKIETWNLAGYQVTSSNDRSARSKLHLEARKLIHEVFSPMVILEEVPIPIKRGITLYLDFFLPLRRIAIEVNGKQHGVFTPFYHQTVADFKRSKHNDQLKREWCELNGITLIEFNYDESLQDWKDKIT
jgi:hypothetical protein